MNDGQLIHMEVHCDLDAPCVVREAIDEALAGEPVHEDARLIASELVTNAVRYSGCAPAQLLEFCASVKRESLVLSVADPGISGQDVHMRHDLVGGYGLRIVDRLSRRWGAERPDGQRVWAELPLARPA
jgi:anti-sigma regulatory factor (Ser/Thr protein kinase)